MSATNKGQIFILKSLKSALLLTATTLLLLSASSCEVFQTPKEEGPPPTAGTTAPTIPSISITSSAFGNIGTIPVKFTCDGSEISPGLNWTAVEGTKSYAILLKDTTDSDGAHADHWLVYNIPGDVTELKEGASGAMPEGIEEGKNDTNTTGYLGPCQPEGSRHRYSFSVLALSELVEVNPELKLTDFETNNASKVIARGSLVGTYER